MEEHICCSIKNSDLNVPKEKRAFLTYPAPGLCPCTLEELEDGISLSFETGGMEPAETIREKPRTDRLRFTVNIAGLEALHKDYSFSLALDNLMTDRNLRPFVLSRDMNCEGASFLQKYKAVIGQTLTSKYSYSDYLNGGEDLYKKNKLLSEIAELDTAEGVRSRLSAEYDESAKKIAGTKKLVSKNSVILSRISIPLLAAALIVAAYFAISAIFVDIPHQEQIIEASIAYIGNDFIAAQAAMRGIEPPDMTHETKHFLARSYVITEAMSDEQKEHVLMGLTRMTDGAILDFWIYLGRLDFEASTEIAQRFGDSQLLLFVYIKQRAFVQASTTIPGEERAALLNRLESEITRLRNELTIEEEVEEE